MKVYETRRPVQSLEISEPEGLNPVHVRADNYESGYGDIRITHERESWPGYWFCTGGRTVQQVFISCGNDEAMKKMTLMTGVKPEDETLCRIFDAVREAFRRYEVQDKS